MAFSENVQYYRKKLGYTQEELGEELLISRQSISKWEQGLAYPEMDKLLIMCELFDCDLDSLVRKEMKDIYDIQDKKTEEKSQEIMDKEYFRKYVRVKNQSKLLITSGVFTGICAIAFVVASYEFMFFDSDAITTIIFLAIGVLAAMQFIVGGFISMGLDQKAPDLFVEGEVQESRNRLMVSICMCVVFAFVGISFVILTNSGFLFILFAGTGATIIVYSALDSAKYNTKDFNHKFSKSYKINELFGSIYWPIVVMIFLFNSIVNNSWGTSWIIFPIAGLLYAAIEALINLVYQNKQQDV